MPQHWPPGPEGNLMTDLADLLTEHKLPGLPEPLGVATIDSHTHLDLTVERLGLDVATLLALATCVGVDRVVQIGCDVNDSRWAVETAAAHEQVIASVAIHPNTAARHAAELDEQLRVIEQLAAQQGKVRAVGETGLDYYRTPDPADQAVQKRSFAAHIAIAKRYDRTLVIHDREAHDDIADLLDAEGWPERVVFHCFSGDAAFARRVLECGAYCSMPGVVTYPANRELVEAMLVVPPDRLLVETDAPYLTPVPHRGKPNASYLVPHTVRFLAERRGVHADELAAQIRANTFAAFGGAW